MRRRVTGICMTATLALCGSLWAGDLTALRTIERSIDVGESGATKLIVDNVWGSISVRGHDGPTIELRAEETIEARTEDRIEQALREVELEVLESDGEVELYVNGPFRCQDRGEEGNCWNRWRNRYTAIYDFEIRVPRGLDLELSTVTGGNVEVRDVVGDFEVHNVNGSIELHGMAGSGNAVTVNGRVVASFASNPTSNSHFETVNGKIDVSFQPDLSADLEMLARWGELWSEYEVRPLPSLPPTQRTKDGRTVIEFQRGTRVRVSDGGPVHSFETLNGNIFVRKRTSERGENDA